MRLTILGGGGFRVPQIYHAVASQLEASAPDEVVLHDVDEGRLRGITEVLRHRARGISTAPRVVATTDLDTALEGASFVFVAIRVGGLQGRAADERAALAEGVLGQETVGLGGLSFALRTVPVAVRLAEHIAMIAPGAWTVNFTNPAGMVTEAMARVLGDRVIGICDSPAALCHRVAAALDVDPDCAWFDYAGLNHLGWLRGVYMRGRDVLPALIADDRALESFEEGRLFGSAWIRALAAIPNEYLYYYDFAGDAVRAMRAEPASRGEFLLQQQRQFYEAVASDPAAALAHWQRAQRERAATYMAESRGASGAEARDSADLDRGGYEDVAVNLLRALLAGGLPGGLAGSSATLILNVRNRSALPDLPPDAVVEVSCVVDGNGARPVAAGWMEPHERGLVQRVKAVERTAIEAALTGSRSLALRAFASHPLAGSVATAERVLEASLRQLPPDARLH